MRRRSKNRLMLPLLLAALVLGYVAGRYTSRDIAAGPQKLGSATLTWLAPIQNMDESPLTDLAGYAIRCWNQSGQLDQQHFVDDPLATTYTIDDLIPGVYHCAVSAINENGIESGLSNIVANIVSAK